MEEIKSLDDLIPINRLIEVMANDESIGFCVCCGNEIFGVDPDTKNMKCDNCGKFSVFGSYLVAEMMIND